MDDPLDRRVSRLLARRWGREVRVVRREPIGEGWSAQFGAWPWVTRCFVAGVPAGLPTSVIVKVRRPASHQRGERRRFDDELAALAFLAKIGSTAGPRLLACDVETGTLVIEDLGMGPALEDILLGDDARAAERGLLAFARALGRVHAATTGKADGFYALRRSPRPIYPAGDRVAILGNDIAATWRRLEAIVAARPYLPAPRGVRADVAALIGVLAQPGPYLAFSFGDTCPQNCRMTGDDVRFLDFEEAAFRHVALDAAALCFPFPACPCWSRLPEAVTRALEAAYLEELTRAEHACRDEAAFAHGMAAACAAWTIVRAIRIQKLEVADTPHPLGFSRRGQLLDTIGVAAQCAREAGTLTALAGWLDGLGDALRTRWALSPSAQPVYPAFRGSATP